MSSHPRQVGLRFWVTRRRYIQRPWSLRFLSSLSLLLSPFLFAPPPKHFLFNFHFYFLSLFTELPISCILFLSPDLKIVVKIIINSIIIFVIPISAKSCIGLYREKEREREREREREKERKKERKKERGRGKSTVKRTEPKNRDTTFENCFYTQLHF